MGLDKCIMTNVDDYIIAQNIFTTLEILRVPHIHPFLPLPQLLATTDLFTVSIVLPFPEYYVVGIIQYGTYQCCLLLLSNTYLRFLHVFSCLDISFIFSNE